MDSADQKTTTRKNRDGADSADRAAALRARIRELRGRASNDARDEASSKVADTQQSSTTEIEGAKFAGLARQINRGYVGAIPSVPDVEPTAPNRIATRWRYLSGPQPGFADSTQPRQQRAIKSIVTLTPVWLISTVFHAVLIIALALLTYTQARFAPPIIIAGNHLDPETLPELNDHVEIGDPSSETEEPFWSPDVVDPGPLDLEVSNELAAPELSIGLASVASLSDQLTAALKIDGFASSGQRKSGSGAQFYGIQAQGDRFVFIVDSSTSMRHKFADARRELEQAVKGLNKSQFFYVIFFDRDAERLRLGKWNSRGTRYEMKNRPEPNLVPASSENIEGLIYWMNTIQLDSDTNPHPAVVYALRKLQPDAIFLLSDGEFNEGGSTEAFLLKANLVDDPRDGPVPKTIIHCVGFYSRQGEITLKRIADTHGGTYRFVEPPRGLIISPLFGPTRPAR